MSRIWILGPESPERNAIQDYLADRREEFILATHLGHRVTEETWDKTDPPEIRCEACGDIRDPRSECFGFRDSAFSGGGGFSCGDLHKWPELILVECGGSWSRLWKKSLWKVREICPRHLHERSGFPPPWDFLQTSPLMQVCMETDGASFLYYSEGNWRLASEYRRNPLVIRKDILHAAVGESYLVAAYQGRCPGVDPSELLEWRQRALARILGMSVEQVKEQFALALHEVRSPRDWLLNDRARIKMIRTTELPEKLLEEASAWTQTPFILEDQIEGRKRVKALVYDFEQEKLFKSWAGQLSLVLKRSKKEPASWRAEAVRERP